MVNVILELKITNKALKTLRDMKKRMNANSLTEVIAESLKLFNFIVREHKKGKKIILQHSDGTMRELIIPG